MPTRTLEHGIPGILHGLSDELRTALEEAEVRVRYRDGEQIQARGDRTPGLRIVRAGAVRAGNVGAGGEYLVLGVFGPGQTFGEMTLFAGLPRTFDVHASGPTTIGYIDEARMDRLLRDHPELARLFLRTLATQLHAALEFVEDLRRLSVTVHVAKLLSTMVKTETKIASLEVTQESLGKILGVTRISVARALDRLEEDGLLRRCYGRIEVPDVACLRAWVAEHSKLPPARSA
ncbi:MAG TPA: Crp/Fnr family transcriptional regulator [Polyangiales bacterium]|nr:Crp/Fnr family transcriptional regulator [Polyangiales bacterium]